MVGVGLCFGECEVRGKVKHEWLTKGVSLSFSGIPETAFLASKSSQGVQKLGSQH